MSLVVLDHATKRFMTSSGGLHTAVSEVSLTVEAGEFVAVVGPTGCGKSTTLSLISGLEPPSEGTATVAGKPVTGIPDGVGYMFQTDAMLPWRTVLGNVAAGPMWRGVAKDKARDQAREWIERVGLKGFENYYMHQLSGGMRKRVALAQTLVNNPSILLMDEPFSALDVQTRALMQNELLNLWSDTNAAVVFVTHDLEEAITLADRVVVMTASPARIKDVFTINLPRPRNVEEIRMTPEFIAIYSEVWQSLSSEVEIARTTGANRVA
ncbi:ABC transporter ATP-binding protein [Calidifontibacter sp. DB0510]|uniref:ABC transporter ATP-binding protein n=1 Tax=Metallococcus carri TaxID=1656884 RepID=A0A967EE98_9MICO|nr:ABC transporter ATP-binding protein [Metallococcus carri]NHN55471.1 ABC transporter ATP-binding protein [Metallococcus carri]NOP38345.1 ABC transporter ATP-binding protein [Calidifontibacter sp. DB2511S]